MLVAPELALSGYAVVGEATLEELLARVKALAQNLGRWILLGHPSLSDRGLVNAAWLVSPQGLSQVVAEKEGLFPNLDRDFKTGQRREVFTINGFSLGVVLCYELRFPEVARRLVASGAQALVVLSQWPALRARAFEVLLEARAVENQVYVLAANALGEVEGLKLAGGSAVYAPGGSRLKALKEEGVLEAVLETQSLSEARKLFNTSAPWPPPLPETKIRSLEDLLPEVKRRRTLGHRLVFTNGCFDLLHAGHVTYLYQARRFGDFLVVGLNSDASVRRIKGPERPINPEKRRALVLAGLACVDYVVLFEEDTPERLIRALAPEVLVKGADWPEDKIVGADWVKSYGGQVVRLPFEHPVSTTDLIRKIRGS